MEFKVGFRTDIGMRRQQNQDNGVYKTDLGLFMVADGMGGHKGGETASQIVVDTVPRAIESSMKNTRDWNPTAAIIQAIYQSNEVIFQRSQRDKNLTGMGTTTTALLFKNELLTVGHVGDSRCYFFQRGACWQITRDHSLVEEKLRAGLITREQLRTDQMKNVITRSVGFEPDLEVDTYEMSVSKGDVFMLCSDGLSGMVENEEIQTIIEKNCFEDHMIQAAADGLVQAANNNGGDDNITVIVIQVGS